MSSQYSEQHLSRGVDHAPSPPRSRGHGDLLPRRSQVPGGTRSAAAGAGQAPDFIHFLDIGNGDRLAFFSTTGLQPRGD